MSRGLGDVYKRQVLGPFYVGDNAKIAAGAVVLEEVPPDCTAVGVPARVVRRNGQRVCPDLDQIHIPDPVAQELCRLTMRIEKLEEMLSVQPDSQEKENEEYVPVQHHES